MNQSEFLKGFIGLIVIVFIVTLFVTNPKKENNETEIEQYIPPPVPLKTRQERMQGIIDSLNIRMSVAVMSQLENPKSFEFAGSVFEDKKDYLIVLFSYRASNYFGGIVTEKMVIMSDTIGNVLDVKMIEK